MAPGIYPMAFGVVDSETEENWTRTCSCRLWQIDGFPCMHVVAAILAKSYYSSNFFRKAYESPTFPIPNIRKGLDSNGSAAGVVLLPIAKRLARRPPTKRIKAFGEVTRPLKCSRCSVAGQNRKTCKAVI
ncbi:uncharacterized protein LOC117625626 [Prunus dulcis]|uniref:uncharacterized protein LOC117625626 n=1 Tax=Prunus dulcis TaxID=3755 RepID=UPI001483C540|nr:uncharacterized protein LOC117625626 [Prunus dulcis]